MDVSVDADAGDGDQDDDRLGKRGSDHRRGPSLPHGLRPHRHPLVRLQDRLHRTLAVAGAVVDAPPTAPRRGAGEAVVAPASGEDDRPARVRESRLRHRQAGEEGRPAPLVHHSRLELRRR